MTFALSPAAFATKYMCLDVYFYPPELSDDDKKKPGADVMPGWQTLIVDDYRLSSSEWAAGFWTEISKRIGKSTITTKVRPLFADADEERGYTAAQLQQHFHNPFVGKGSPEDVQIALQLLYRYHRAKFTPSEMVALNFVGLDCNGFVGNYIQRVVKGSNQQWSTFDANKDPGPTTVISGLIENSGLLPVKSLADLKSEGTYVCGMCLDNGSIVDPPRDQVKGHEIYGHCVLTEPLDSEAGAGRPHHHRRRGDICRRQEAAGRRLRDYRDHPRPGQNQGDIHNAARAAARQDHHANCPNSRGLRQGRCVAF